MHSAQMTDCIPDVTVALAFDSHPPAVRARLLALRGLVLDVAAQTEGVGPLTETLKWGQPSYLTQQSRSGTTVRVHAPDAQTCGLYVHCQSQVVDAARAQGLKLTFDGTRAALLPMDQPIAEADVRVFIALALTYHRWKSRAAV